MAAGLRHRDSCPVPLPLRFFPPGLKLISRLHAQCGLILQSKVSSSTHLKVCRQITHWCAGCINEKCEKGMLAAQRIFSMRDQSKPTSTSPEPIPVAHALEPGDAIMEYVIERTLGGGSFGITYLARDKNLDMPVAVKEYLPSSLAMRAADNSVHTLGDAFNEQFQWGLERFLAEARVLATFRHPNIVRVLRYFFANGTAYIVMEYESGESLKHWFPRQGILTQASLLRLLFPLLDSLEVIHAANFLHRDIKPDNIYIREDGTPVLIDFGSARTINSNRDPTNIVSPGFAPFEQYHSKGNQGPWTDLYSLAAVMYWLVSGAKPLDSLSRQKQDSMMPAMQSGHKGRFDEPLLKSIDWALNPEEAQRPQNVAEFRCHLQASLGEERTVTAPDLRTQPLGYLGGLRNKHGRSHEPHVARTGSVVERQSDNTIPLNAKLGGTSPWRELAGRLVRGAGRVRMEVASQIKARIPAATIFVSRIRIRIQDAIHEIYIASRKNTYWWKFLLATMAAACAGWVFGGAAWGAVLGLSTLILGGLNLLRVMHKSFTANLPEENAGKSKFAISIWSRQNVRPILLAVSPSVLLVVLLWAVLPFVVQYPEPGAVVEASQLANDKLNIDGSVTKPTSLRHDAKARANLRKAQKMLAEKNYTAAIRLAKAVLKKYPRNTRAQAILKEARAEKKLQDLS